MAWDKFTTLSAPVSDLEIAWQDRLKDADAALKAKRPAAAIANGLYALEIRLKVMICKTLRLTKLPRAFEIHDLASLMLLAGHSDDLEHAGVQVKDNWSEILGTLRAKQRATLRAESALEATARRRVYEATARTTTRSVVMAVEVGMKQAIKRLQKVFEKYAQTQGWSPEDYKLLFHVNPLWGHIQVVVIGKRFPGKNHSEHFASVHNFVKDELGDAPPLWSSLAIVVRTFEDLDSDALAPIGPEYVEASDL